DVPMRPGHAVGSAAGIAQGSAAGGEPAVLPILVQHPRLERQRGGEAIEVVLKVGEGTRAVLRVDARAPFLKVVLDLVIGVAEELLPARGVVDLLGGEVPVPEAIIRATQEQLIPLLEVTCAGLRVLKAREQLPHALRRVLDDGAS